MKEMMVLIVCERNDSAFDKVKRSWGQVDLMGGPVKVIRRQEEKDHHSTDHAFMQGSYHSNAYLTIIDFVETKKEE
jgi:hypothetical protein